jgi:uncharacterized Zn finger protein
MTAGGGGTTATWSSRFLDRLDALGLVRPEQLTEVATSESELASESVSVSVSELRVSAGSAGARVAASDGGRGHDVWIELTAFDARQWARAELALSADRGSREALLDGEVPLRVEAVLARAGLSLLPARAEDLTLECSCPAWATCRHLVAALAALAAAFDADPFLLTAWRGRTRERLLRHIEDLHAAGEAAGPTDPLPEEDVRPPTERLADFWSEGGRHRSLVSGEAAAGAADGVAAGAATAQLSASGVVIRGRSLESLLQAAYDALID